MSSEAPDPRYVTRPVLEDDLEPLEIERMKTLPIFAGIAESTLKKLQPNILLAPYEPGRPVEDVQRELGLERVIKLASNEGPHPPLPAAVEAIREAAALQRVYPDPGCWALRDALSARLGVPAEAIMPGNGVDSMIKLLCVALLEPGDELAMA